MADIKKLGHFIAGLRASRGMTQDELARALHTTQSAVARIEAGKQNLSAETLVKISGIFNRELIATPKSINFKIEGPTTLSGSVTTNSSKNGAVFLLCASLLNEGKTTLHDVPKIEEVNRIIEVLISIGAKIKWIAPRSVEIVPPKKIDLKNLNVESAIKTRSAILLIAPLIHKLKSFKLPHAGGCRLGKRTVRPHFYALQNLGVDIETDSKNYKITVKNKLTPANIVMYETGDTATGSAIMAAARINGTTAITFASSNYQVQELCWFLEKCGVRIEGIGTHNLTIHGNPEIKKNIEYYISEDPIDSMLYITAAVLTSSSIEIKRCPIDFLGVELLKLEKMGFKFKVSKTYKAKNGYTNLVDIKTYPSKLRAPDDKIHPLPYPGLNIDNLPFFVPIACIAEGTTLIHDWIYENRAIHYTELSKLRAEINLIDPHRVQIIGPTKFKPAEIVAPPALRPAAIILLAMLAAPGTSILRDVYSINRGYEDIHKKLNSLGAKIKLF
ncbi:MAG: UDP-N-acetylglucosamine 1-carboxyvinyltransferase [Candidatus Colwellbacteria bacterium]|nr:UDP-N-acetylglucosamine 1-carboxyvinyltransferase [Candidatus Colwellbacteria bacterium]